MATIRITQKQAEKLANLAELKIARDFRIKQVHDVGPNAMAPIIVTPVSKDGNDLGSYLINILGGVRRADGSRL